MLECKKCGAYVEENVKFCDKCGSEISAQYDEVISEVEQESIAQPDMPNIKASSPITEQVENAVHSFLPHPFTKKGDRTSVLIGLGSMAILAITYIICFFSFMPEICLPVGLGIVNTTSSASPLWVIVYFVFNLFPVLFLIKAFLVKKYRLYALFASLGIFVLTLFTLIFWGMCEPSNYLKAVSVYNNSPGSIAWFAFVDCLSEAWYLKFILSVTSVFGFGVDYIVNKGN